MSTETLILRSSLSRTDWFLKATNGAHIGCFDAPWKAEQWAEENDYKVRVEDRVHRCPVCGKAYADQNEATVCAYNDEP